MLAHEKAVWIAHNGGRFDTIFIFKYLLEQKKIYPETIMQGNKIMLLCIREEGIYIFDSYSFIQMRLAAIPKAMGLEEGLCKGFHPYFFMIWSIKVKLLIENILIAKIWMKKKKLFLKNVFR